MDDVASRPAVTATHAPARIAALDHVNIQTQDVGGLCRFFADVLGMQVQPVPGRADTSSGAWVCDAAGHPCIHVARADAIMPGGGAPAGGPAAPGSGHIHHVALRCLGYDAMTARLTACGHTFETNHFPPINLRQIFVSDPNAILFELNFFEDC